MTPTIERSDFGLAKTIEPQELYIAGGRQRKLRGLTEGNQDWNGFDRAVIIQLDPLTGSWRERMGYVSPPDVIPENDPAITYQAGFIQGHELYLCTQTEVMIYRLPDFEPVCYLTNHLFNDLHHARPSPGGNILVANAGLEMVLELDRDGEILQTWQVLGEDPWSVIDRSKDYRRISTKPHRAHPNYLFCIDDEIWATRFHQGDALCVNNPSKTIPLSRERIHDGIVHKGFVYFTTVSGRILIANPRTLKLEATIDLSEMHEPDTLLGWCRGLLIQDEKLWVGFSRIRPTKFRENVSWVMRGFKQAMPTHIACYDLARRRCLQEIDVELMGLGAIYSIFPAVPSVTE